MENKELTGKQKLFVDYYIMTGGNGAEAARLAGYSEKIDRKMASRNLKKPHVRAAIIERQRVLENRRIADIREIKSYWTSLMRGEITAKGYDRRGNSFDREACLRERLRASEDLARAHGAFLRGNAESEKKEFNIIWIDDYGEDSDYNKFKELSD